MKFSKYSEKSEPKNGAESDKRGCVLGKERLTSIILDLLYLLNDMQKNGHIDKETIDQLGFTISNLKYYRQFE